LNGTAIGSDTVQLDWGAATDDIGVTGYRVYRDSAFVTETNALTFTDIGRAPATSYDYEVTAFDAKDNEGPPAGPVAVVTPAPDTEDPSVPGNVQANALAATRVQVQWTESTDNLAVVEYKVYRDSAEIASLPSTARDYEDAGASPETIHAYEVSALDLAGNESDPTMTTVFVTTPAGPADLIAGYGFEEPSGSAVLDASGLGNDGVLENGAARSLSGRYGQALETNGVAGNVDLGALDVDPAATGITLMAWINADDFGTRDARILSKSTSGSSQDHVWMLSTITGPRLRFRLQAGGSTSTLIGSGGTLTSGTWIHAAATYDGTNMRLYQDGVEVGSVAKSGLIGIAPGVDAWIGANPGASSQVFDGRIDELKIFRRALTPAEIATEMATPLP
jgi:hypothetical protein